jgi:predicted nucleotidyltransferase
MDRNIIMNRIKEHLIDVRANGYQPLYLCLQGSQNYNLDYEHSDIDTKAMVVPTLREVVLNNKPVSITHVMENNEHCDLKDIRLMFNNFKKQNINFLEVLFSPYYWIDERYKKEFEQLRAHAEDIARYNEGAAVKCMLGMAREKYKAMEHPYPTLIDKIEKYGYDGKQLHHIVRLREFMERYISGEPFANCLISKHREYLIRLKKNEFPLKEARIIAETELSKMEKAVDNFLLTKRTFNKDVDNFLAEWLVKLFTKIYCEK